MWFHVAESNSYLVITGAGIETVRIKKKALVLPFQKVAKISVTPFDFSLNLQAMTVEKLKFSLPAVFTIGPNDDLKDICKYAVLLTGQADGAPTRGVKKGAVAADGSHVQNIVKGIIEGETRSIVSTMTMEELFRERKVFKSKVIESVQSELDQFGLKIYNANVKELQDTPGSEYFEFLSRKAHEGALNQAKVDVADARMRGEVGEAEKQGKTKQEVAKIHAATAVLETERKAEKASADAKLTNKEIHIERELNIARIEAKRAAEQKDLALQTDVEKKRAEAERERQRATTVTKAIISRESEQQRADAELYTQQKQAEATFFQAEQDANAILYRRRQEASASLVTAQQDADAHLYTQQKAAEADFLMRTRAAEASFIAVQKEAQGIHEMAQAYSELSKVMGGPSGLMQYFMLKNGTYEALARENAKAIHGLQPKINVWNTGNQGEGADPTAPIRNLFQALPPLLTTINDQTGLAPPSWLAQLQGDGGQAVGGGQQQEQQLVQKGKMAKTNGVH